MFSCLTHAILYQYTHPMLHKSSSSMRDHDCSCWINYGFIWDFGWCTDFAFDIELCDRYCECFAAGIYCVGSCACRECLNKPEFEETVLNTRQQIESRNPLAFAPKIIQAAETSPTPGVNYLIILFTFSI